MVSVRFRKEFSLYLYNLLGGKIEKESENQLTSNWFTYAITQSLYYYEYD